MYIVLSICIPGAFEKRLKFPQYWVYTRFSFIQAVCGGFMQKKQEELPNIDADDVGNQLAVVDYIEDIYSFYRKTEVRAYQFWNG